MKTKNYKFQYKQWCKILDELINAGSSFYDFYGDVEIIVADNTDYDPEKEFELLLTGQDDSFEELKSILEELQYD